MSLRKKLIFILALQPVLAVVVFSLGFVTHDKLVSKKTIKVVNPKPIIEKVKAIKKDEVIDWNETKLSPNKKRYLDYLYTQE
jgi:hypothetical protein